MRCDMQLRLFSRICALHDDLFGFQWDAMFLRFLRHHFGDVFVRTCRHQAYLRAALRSHVTDVFLQAHIRDLRGTNRPRQSNRQN